MSALTVAGLAVGVLTAATPAPGSQDVNPTDGGSPGFVGFVFTFVLAVLVIGLMVLFVRGMRRMEHNAGRLSGGEDASPGALADGADDGVHDDRATDADAGEDRPDGSDAADAGGRAARPAAPPAG